MDAVRQANRRIEVEMGPRDIPFNICPKRTAA